MAVYMNVLFRVFLCPITVYSLVSSNMYAARYNTLDTTKQKTKNKVPFVLPKDMAIPKEWAPLLDPKNSLFWKEGSHEPDAGLVLFGQNPSKETAKLWLLRMEYKAKLLSHMFEYVTEAHKELVKEGLIQNRYSITRTTAGTLPSIKNQVAIINKDKKEQIKNIHVYFLFDPNCKFCDEMASKVKFFKNVVPLQTSGDSLKHFSGLPKSSFATQKTLETYLKNGGVPFLVITDPVNKQHTTVEGNVSLEEIMLAASELLNNKRL